MLMVGGDDEIRHFLERASGHFGRPGKRRVKFVRTTHLFESAQLTQDATMTCSRVGTIFGLELARPENLVRTSNTSRHRRLYLASAILASSESTR